MKHTFLLALCFAIFGRIAFAQDEESEKEASLQVMKGILEKTTLEILADDETRKAKLVGNPVFRYSDLPRNIHDSTLWIWRDGNGGRPVALQKIEDNNHTRWTYCFASMCEDRVRVIWPNTPQYKSTESGVSFSLVPDAPKPRTGKTAVKTQLRGIARQFSIKLYSGPKHRFIGPARFLPRPIVEYEDKKHNVIAGAVFGYATGTNPDVLVMVELHTTAQSNRPQWHYAVQRLTNAEITMNYGTRELKSIDWQQYPRAYPNWTFKFIPRRKR